MNGSAGWLWVRCLMDERLHLLDRPRVLDLAEIGCALARCGVLLLIPEVALHPAGQPCPTCLGGLLSSPVDEAECADDDGGPRGADQRGDQVLTPAARFSDHPRGSLVWSACAGADDGGPIPGWPPVEVPPTPGGQPVPLFPETRSTMPENAAASLTCGSSTTIPASCTPHRGPRVFTPLLVETRDREVVLDAQVTDGCQIILDEAGASVLFDLLGAWLTGGEVG